MNICPAYCTRGFYYMSKTEVEQNKTTKYLGKALDKFPTSNSLKIFLTHPQSSYSFVRRKQTHELQREGVWHHSLQPFARLKEKLSNHRCDLGVQVLFSNKIWKTYKM